MVNEKISAGQAIVRLRELPLFGPQLTRLYVELTGGVVRGVNSDSGNIALQGPHIKYEHKGLVVHATITGDSGSVAVLKTSTDQKLELGEGFHRHPDRVAVVRTGYFDNLGNPYPEDRIAREEFDHLGGLVSISKLQQRWHHLGTEALVNEEVEARVRHLFEQEVPQKWILKID